MSSTLASGTLRAPRQVKPGVGRHDGNIGEFRKLLNVTGGILVLAGLSYCSYTFVGAEVRAPSFCNQIKSGMAVEQLRQVALLDGIAPAPKESGTSFIVETKTYGRYGSKVITKGGYI